MSKKKIITIVSVFILFCLALASYVWKIQETSERGYGLVKSSPWIPESNKEIRERMGAGSWIPDKK